MARDYNARLPYDKPPFHVPDPTLVANVNVLYMVMTMQNAQCVCDISEQNNSG